MKKILLLATVVFMAVGCADDDLRPEFPEVREPVADVVTVRATAGSIAAADALGQALLTEWREGDRLIVNYDGTNYAYQAGADGTTVDFLPVALSLPADINGAVAAYFDAPDGVFATGTARESILVPMYAYKSGATVADKVLTLQFNPLVSVLAVTIAQENKTVTSVKVEPVDAQGVEGSLAISEVEFDPATGTETIPESSETDNVLLFSTDGMTLDEDRTVYFTLANGTKVSDGLKVTIDCSDDSSFEKVLFESDLLQFSSNYFAATTELFFRMRISNYEDMVKFADECNINDNGGAIVDLMADIDMQGTAWTPIANFTGTFNGNGHRIYNINVSSGERWAGFFGYAKGAINNVVFGSRDGVSYDGTSKVELTFDANVTDWCYAGIIAQTNNTIDNVVSFVPVTVASTAKCRSRVGGIAGTIYNGTLNECINHGAVSNLSTAGAVSYLGGIAGLIDGSNASTEGNAVTKCENYGDVTMNLGLANHAGGIAGGITSTSLDASVRECVNNANVAFDNITASAAHYLGGIVGDVPSGSTGKIEKCENKGIVSSNMNGNCFMGGVVGRVYTMTVQDCTNGGEVKFLQKNSAGAGYLCIGGVVGQTFSSATVTGCVNNAKVSSDKNQVNRTGGIVGTHNASTVESCINNGEIYVESPSNANWQAVGGVVGFYDGTDGAATAKNSTNTAKVTAIVNSTNANIGTGGIVGIIKSGDAEGNVNRGDVSMTNHSAGKAAYAGGIVGYDYNTADKSFVKNNVNYAAVASVVTGGSDSAAAGGVVGRNDVGAVSDCESYGAITCAKYAGAVAGWNLNTIADCKAGGSVNGTALSAGNVDALGIAYNDGGTVTGVVFATMP